MQRWEKPRGGRHDRETALGRSNGERKNQGRWERRQRPRRIGGHVLLWGGGNLQHGEGGGSGGVNIRVLCETSAPRKTGGVLYAGPKKSISCCPGKEMV